MDAMQDDIQALNEKLFALASAQRLGDRVFKLLGAAPAVLRRIATAKPNTIEAAVRCRVPLIRFTSAVEELLLVEPSNWSESSAGDEAAELQDLTYFALELARSLANRQPTMVQMQFGLSRGAVERLGRLGLRHILKLSRCRGTLLRLRTADHIQVWDRLLIADRCEGPKAHRISQQVALQSLSAES